SNLGKLGIDISVKDKNVNFTFNTQNDLVRNLIAANAAILRKKMAEENYNTSGFLVRTNPSLSMIKPYLVPLLDLEALLKVDVEA
ncbi:MAG: flagellar hook-length control protein FliK, partial [bacterium]